VSVKNTKFVEKYSTLSHIPHNFCYSHRMKKLLTITILIFTVMLSSPSYAEWMKVEEGVGGHSFYVEFERI